MASLKGEPFNRGVFRMHRVNSGLHDMRMRQNKDYVPPKAQPFVEGRDPYADGFRTPEVEPGKVVVGD